MAKGPKNQKSPKKSVNYSQGARKRASKSVSGGKSIEAYKHNFFKNRRRFSLVESSSAGSESDSMESNEYSVERSVDASISDSSLTDVSESEEKEKTRRLSAISGKRSDRSSKKGKKPVSGNISQKRATKKYGKSIKKNFRGKTSNWDWDSSQSSSSDSEDSEDSGSDSDSNNEALSSFAGIYSINNASASDSSDSDLPMEKDEDEDEDAIDNDSSSDDSDIDFIKLQAERKANKLRDLRSLKGLSRSENKTHTEADSKSTPVSDLKTKRKHNQKLRNKKSDFKKLSRRRSDVPFPNDFKFTLEFGDGGETAIADSDTNEEGITHKVLPEEEDIGEEVPMKILDGSSKVKNDYSVGDGLFDFDSNFHLEAPKLKDEDINSDEDYEIDDNDLLATLQADNDFEQFANNSIDFHSRKSSVVSGGDEDENDLFLKEEEKFLVNEFENNGFDDENEIGDINFKEASDSAQMRNNRSTTKDVSQNPVNLEVHKLSKDEEVEEEVYEEEEEEEEEDDDEEEEEEEDEYDDIIDLNVPFLDDNSSQYKDSFLTSNNQSHKFRTYNSDEDDDDSYLWNYFFSSDNSSSELEDEHQIYSDEESAMKTLFKGMKRAKSGASLSDSENTLSYLVNDLDGQISSDNESRSGDSTDVDLSLPEMSNNKVGSKVAKEVLSSKTADYRPPVLGTWVTVDSQPFGIIDGLSTRTLTPSSNPNKSSEPRSAGRKTKMTPRVNSAEESALGLDELLNISELDDENENDIRIWRDFNSQKKRVPLGAFRNKSVLLNPPLHIQAAIQNSLSDTSSKSLHSFSKSNRKLNHGLNSRRQEHFKKPSRKNIPKPTSNLAKELNSSSMQNNSHSRSSSTKSKRRRASMAEAVSAGLRPTKSGLFSEDALANVEELLGDDSDLMSLISGV